MGRNNKSLELNKIQKEQRLGLIRENNHHQLMKIVEYNGTRDVVVEFQDKYKKRVHAEWKQFQKGEILNPIYKEEREGMIVRNNQGCLMQCIEYIDTRHIRIKFLDNYGYEKDDKWWNFIRGTLNNPYHPSLYGVACLGAKYYKREKNKENVKVYQCWSNMLIRCFDEKYKEKEPTYKDVTCCEDWLCYENFVDWIISQDNYDVWLNNKQWALDKDIIKKGNKIYSPETCCLVPKRINNLFVKNTTERKDNYPVGVYFNYESQRYQAQVSTLRNNKNYRRNCGYYPTPEDAFYLGYKPYKEKYIQRIAQEEYELGNITKACYEAMMNYQVEITD